MKTWNRVLALVAVLALALVFSVSALAEAAAPGEAAGFVEYPLTDDNEQQVQITEGTSFNVAGVYFQPVDMEPVGMGLSPADSNIHLEADISALENDLGYGVGDWIPYMTVDYTIVSETTGEVAAEGTFMVMNASDGPHYGANIALTEADTYTVTFTLHSPEENGFLLHVDAETGVPGKFWSEPVEVVFSGWDYIPQEW
ncbi:MAG: iron transporter [Clostridia bacterium]|nr:iron transporter [Clostridia bacterium]MBQ8972160.1 iron transporter [Clostridia bacterium]